MNFVTIFIPRSCTSSYLVTFVKTYFEVLDLQTFCDVCTRRLSVSYRDQHLDRFVFYFTRGHLEQVVTFPRVKHTVVFIFGDPALNFGSCSIRVFTLFVYILVFCTSCESPPK